MTTRKDITAAYLALMEAVREEREAEGEQKAVVHQTTLKAHEFYVNLKNHCWK